MGVVTKTMCLLIFYAMPCNKFYLNGYVLYLFWFASYLLLLYVILILQVHLIYNITWLFMCALFVDYITWCMYYRDYGLHFGGGLILLFMYHHLCVYFINPCSIYPCCISCNIKGWTLFYILYAYFLVHISPSFSF